MSFRDCLLSAVDQGAISKDEAAELQRRFDDEFAQARLALGDDGAAAAAKIKLEKDLRAEGFERRRRVLLQDAVQDRLAGYVASYRDLKGGPDVFGAVLNLIENHGFAGTSSLAGRQKAIVSLVHGELADVLETFRKSAISGRRFNKPMLDDVVRDALGSPSGKPEAKAMADAIQSVFETLRQRFNAAGGAIGKIEGGYLPQFHDPRALLNAGRDQWKGFIRPLLDTERMKDPLTGDRLTASRLDQVLDASFDLVTTDGWSNRQALRTPQGGKGMLASQRAEHRFLHFKDADGWLKYNEQFGKGDPLKAIFEHINGMARDIAAMEQFGPNPNATVEWLKQIVQVEAAKSIAGKPSLYAAGSKTADSIRDKIDYLPYRIDGVYQYVRGRSVVSGNMAIGFGNVRNLLTSALLGSASITAAMTDPFVDASTRYLSGLPITKALWGLTKTFSEGTKRQAVRSGIVMDDFLHILGDEARFAGQVCGSEWSKWLAERTLALSGLEPMTQARKHVFALDFQAAIADRTDRIFDALDPYLKRALEGYGIDRTAWDVIRATPAHAPEGGAGFIRPIDVAGLADGPALPKVQQLLGIDSTDQAVAAAQTAAGVRRIAEQYLEVILQQTERAVPTSTARSRSFFVGTQPKGSFWGEIVESGLLFKSFTLSFTTLQLQAIQQELHQSGARGAAYAGSMALALTLGGGMALQIKNVINGKDPMPMDDPRFWLQALQTGGGVGLLGDFMFADASRQNQSLASTIAGPTVGAANDLMKLTVGNAQELLRGKDTHAGREAVNTLGRYMPVASSLWYMRTAYRRVMLDQLQYLADPEAHKNFRQQEQRLQSESHQEFWWRPGNTSPSRAPQMAR
ncbi:MULTISPECIES: hypothetical protein [Rhodopseudomonas]|uniref:Uncharacterized protein n=1 Tax=Rhodopseudomonas palustris TaxID=1076 RepID=A0A0D7F2T7_RHOPL|nr:MULTISPECIES: hypothetical protein [Rhodopseudomonas]KIZ47398.1 hypothetical protein OO17_04635 [Rhodopseudomonas palustris]MDF3809257.1 hypothetical protein [Rhodopseudomonas sp. BAL398]WOK19058.1 hypothetical protein RBJ75_05940 [Rhodopseudomonas sp. BAL398]